MEIYMPQETMDSILNVITDFITFSEICASASATLYGIEIGKLTVLICMNVFAQKIRARQLLQQYFFYCACAEMEYCTPIDIPTGLKTDTILDAECWKESKYLQYVQ